MLGALLGLLALGCRGPDQPRHRMGALPYPSIMSAWATADPRRLGTHRSKAFPPPPFAPFEVERGIIYTTRGGFVDMAHIRGTIDWTHYCHRKVKAALESKQTALSIPGPDRVTYHLRLNYPSDWEVLPLDRRGTIREELAIRMAQQIAYVMMTWHEVQTWYGYRSSGIIDERPSAFTYDDVLSHWAGIEVAGRALRRMRVEDIHFDRAVTDALTPMLRELGALTPAETTRAARAVEGSWWAGIRPLKRHVDPGLDEGWVRPWRVPGLEKGTQEEIFPLPNLANIEGRSFTGMYELELEPTCWEARSILARLPQPTRRVRVDRDLPLLLDAVRADVVAREGANAIRIGSPLRAAPVSTAQGSGNLGN